MAAPWSSKGSKSTLVAADEFLILDSQDATAATKNKRVTLANAQKTLVTNVDGDGNELTNLTRLTVVRTDGLQPIITVDSYSNIIGNGALFDGRRARGTLATPLALQDNDFIFALRGLGFNGSFFKFTSCIDMISAGTWSLSSFPSSMLFSTTDVGETIPSGRYEIQSDGTSDFKNNIIQNIASIKLDDSDASHSYTILGSNLTGDHNVTIPAITTNDTFALLNTENTFTANQTITFADDTITDGLTVANTDGGFTFGNATATANEFAGLLEVTTLGNGNGFTTDVSITPSDTGSIPVSVLNLRQSDDTDVENRPLWEIQNNGTIVLAVEADGTVDITNDVQLRNNQNISWRNSTDDNDFFFRLNASNLFLFTGNTGTSVRINPVTATINSAGGDMILKASGADNLLLGDALTTIGTSTIFNDRYQGKQGADVASATNITLGNGNFFSITGTTTINTMNNTGWQAGSVVFLRFNSGLTVTHNSGGSPPNADFELAGSVDFVVTSGDTLTVVFGGTSWRELSRTII